ncbi:MAG: type II secretion system protein [Roseibacillus sp.]|nr:type II secretion system protein [Roseibacillus sp.]
MKFGTRLHPSGFTITEILVSIVILVSLLTLGGAVTFSAIEKARMTKEVSAAKELITGWQAYASENGGAVMPGFREDPQLTNLKGEPLSFPINARYPWKLAHYVGRMEDGIVFNGNEKLLTGDQADYRVSVSPNLGVNAVFVGGHYGTGSPLPPSERIIERLGKFVVTHISEPHDPGKLIVFASARSAYGAGYFEVRPPAVLDPVWSGEAFMEDGRAADHGFVDLRWNGKAVAAMAGGNVELLDEEALRDMRRWSNQAALENESDFTIKH